MSYPPIYVINLKRTPERKLHMQRELDALNLSYQFVEAIDKHDLHRSDYRRTLARQLNIDENLITSIYKNRRIGAVACALSHIKVYNLMIEKNISVACILEDDGHILPTFPDVLAASKEVSWDILMFSHQSKAVHKLSRVFSQNLWKSIIFPKLFKLIFYKKFYPALTFSTVYLTLMNAAKYATIHYLSKLKKPFVKYRNNIRREHNSLYRKKTPLYRKKTPSKKKYSDFQYQACQQGAIPSRGKSLQLKSTSDHYIAQPEKMLGNRPTSAMAYMLTHSAAIKWRCQFISHPCPIDVIPFDLYQKEDLNLYMVIPPCVTAASNYLFYSSRYK